MFQVLFVAMLLPGRLFCIVFLPELTLCRGGFSISLYNRISYRRFVFQQRWYPIVSSSSRLRSIVVPHKSCISMYLQLVFVYYMWCILVVIRSLQGFVNHFASYRRRRLCSVLLSLFRRIHNTVCVSAFYFYDVRIICIHLVM